MLQSINYFYFNAQTQAKYEKYLLTSIFHSSALYREAQEV